MKKKKLIIIGCGPKAVAIAVKAKVLKELGFVVPKISIIEKSHVGANWTGNNGYTSGDLTLGTSPLEDIGFPYVSSQKVNKLMQQYSWIAYLIATKKYGEWTDRALPAPTHKEFAAYYAWVIKKAKIPVILGEVIGITKEKNQWKLTYLDGKKKKILLGDALLPSGPGEPYDFSLEIEPGLDDTAKSHIFNGKNIWHHLDVLKKLENASIAVIGGGETAAGVVTGLLKMVHSSVKIEIINGHGMIFTRNENWIENRYFTNAHKWSQLSEKHRVEIIKHGDRGTFSPKVKNLLDTAMNVDIVVGKFKKASVTQDGIYVILETEKKILKKKYDFVISAHGFNPLWFVKLFQKVIPLGGLHEIVEGIDTDLSLKNFSPKLFLPTLAGLTQGPGFCNLSCLGMLSDRILMSYAKKKGGE
ncbi:MAG TPA: SidA/IucD/PvdA family monooxygenase [Candidatus Eisenbacteria bacterium]|nr:SidA/IucD/PvdA family monooxygenase [Candidatus Eisenbacteria bacterium]